MRSSSRSRTGRRGSTPTSTRAGTSRTSTAITTPPSHRAGPLHAPLVPHRRPTRPRAGEVRDVQGPPGAHAVPERAVWLVNLAVIAAFFVLLLLIRAAADAVVAGAGTPVAVMLGLGTILLPFASALLRPRPFRDARLRSLHAVFCASGEPSATRGFCVAAGALAGLAVVVELPLVLVAAALGAYSLVDSPRSDASHASAPASSPAFCRSLRTTHGPSDRHSGPGTPTPSSWSARPGTTSSARMTRGSSGSRAPASRQHSTCSSPSAGCSSSHRSRPSRSPHCRFLRRRSQAGGGLRRRVDRSPCSSTTRPTTSPSAAAPPARGS